MIVMKQLPNLLKVVIVNNEMIIKEDQEISAQAFQFKDAKLKRAKMFAKRSLKCLAFKIN